MTWQNKHLSARIVKFELYRVFPTFSYVSLIQGFIITRAWIITWIAKKETRHFEYL